MAVHYDLSVIAIVGIILLIGIVKKNGIMLVDFAQHVEHEQGLTAEESIYQACIMRFRPILMTTMAALLGGVPMMLVAESDRSFASRSATPSSAASLCHRFSRSIRRLSSISISTGCRPGCSGKRSKRPRATPRRRLPNEHSLMHAAPYPR